MAFIPIPHTVLVRIRLVTAVAALEATVGVYFMKPDFGQDDMEDLADHLALNFVPDLMAELCDDYTANLISVYDMRAIDGYVHHKTISEAGGSAIEDTPISPAQCCVVSFYGAKRGKWNQGRNYVPGLTEQDCDQVDIGATTTAAVLAAYQGLIDTPPTGWTWVVASRYLNNAPREAGITSTIESVQIRSPRFGFQRRRARRP